MMEDIKEFFADLIQVFKTESIVNAISLAILLAILLSIGVPLIGGLLYCFLIMSWDVHWLVGLTVDFCFIMPFALMAYAKLSNNTGKTI